MAKEFGFTHAEIKNLVEPAQWYQGQAKELTDELEKSGYDKNTAAVLSEGLTYYLADNAYDYKSTEKLTDSAIEATVGTPATQKQLLEALANPRVSAAAKNFADNLKSKHPQAQKICDLDKRFKAFGGTCLKGEELKYNLAKVDLQRTFAAQDPKAALLEEFRSRMANGEKETGFIGSPLRLLNVVSGKNDHEDPAALQRMKLYFIYKSKSITNEIVASPELRDKVNAKLASKGWQLDGSICNELYQASPTSPIFKLGSYAAENWKGNIRKRITPQQAADRHAASDKLSVAASEKLALRQAKASNEEQNAPFRFRMSPQEEMAYFSTNSELDYQELDRRQALFGAQGKGPHKIVADTGFLESPLEWQKKSSPMPWICGKNFFQLHDSKISKSDYLKPIKALGLPQQAGISGSTDQTMTMAGVLGVNTPQELKQLRLMYLGWMTSNDDHSVDEILTAAKSFGLPYTPAPDYYRDIYPESPDFLQAVAAGQKKRHFELPEKYLSKEYAQEQLNLLRKQKDAAHRDLADKELAQSQKVKSLLATNNLFMKALFGPKKGSVNDLLEEKSWAPFLKRVSQPKSLKASQDKMKYSYNPETKRLEPRQPKAKPQPNKGTAKTSVSLLPTNGKILPYRWNKGESVGLLFDRSKSPFKDKYVFKADALTDDKWWKRYYSPAQIAKSDFPELLKKDIRQIENVKRPNGERLNDLRAGNIDNLIAKIEKVTDFQKHNEILASLKKEGIVGIFGFNKKNASREEIFYTRLRALTQKIALKDNQGINVPIFKIDQAQDKGLHLYSREEQLADLKQLQNNSGGAFDKLVDFLAAKTHHDKASVNQALKGDVQALALQLA